MVQFWQFGFVLIFLCFDNGGSFQTDILGSEQLTEELRSLVGETIFGYDELLLSWCQKQHPENVSLDLSNLGIKNLPKKFVSSPHVTCLDLQGNSFETDVAFNIFQMQPNLEYLNLGNNSFDLQVFLKGASHSRIKTLLLDNLNNKIEDNYNRHHEYRYRNYKGYHYNDNNYDGNYKTEEITLLSLQLPNLEVLSLKNLNSNLYNRFNYQIWSFNLTSTKLTHLFLSGTKIGQINETILNTLPATLTHLFVENCNLKSYNSSSKQSIRLISLSMDRNLFFCWNDDCLNFKGHPELKYLSMAYCGIIDIPYDTFFFNSKLVYLDISGNQILLLNERVFFNTPALESLNLNDNQLLKIPNMESLNNLKKLYVKGNQITHVDQDSFSSLENLNILSLSSNNIEFIDGSAFDNLLSLTVLDLSSNKLSSLEYRTSFNLEYLILTDNLISSVENIVIGNNTLKYLVLTNNPIMSVKTKFLKFLSEDANIVIKKPPTS